MADGNDNRRKVMRFGGALLLGALYYATARGGLGLGAVGGFAALVWPPTGIAIAALYLWGSGLWPAVAVAAFLANYHTGAPWIVAAGIAAGNVGEALLASYLLKKWEFTAPIERTRDAVAYVVLAALMATLVSPTVGVTSLLLGDVVQADAYGITWLSWWVGDALGALVVGTLVILVVSAIRTKYRLQRPAEALALIATLVCVSAVVFSEPFGLRSGSLPITYVVFIPLLWAAVRFGALGASVATLIVSVIAMWGTVHGVGPFVRGSGTESLLFLQLFMGVIAGTKLIVAAESAERRRAEAELRRAGKGLERQVVERTGQLSKAHQNLGHSKVMLEKRGAVLQAVLHSIGEGVAAFDTEGNPIVINQGAMRMTGMQQSQAETKLESLAKAFPLYYMDGVTPVPFGDLPVTRALRGEMADNERFLLKTPKAKDGMRVSISSAPIRGERGAITGGVIVIREIPS